MKLKQTDKILHQALKRGPRIFAELIDRTGFSYLKIKKGLRRLIGEGLIERLFVGVGKVFYRTMDKENPSDLVLRARNTMRRLATIMIEKDLVKDLAIVVTRYAVSPVALYFVVMVEPEWDTASISTDSLAKIVKTLEVQIIRALRDGRTDDGR